MYERPTKCPICKNDDDLIYRNRYYDERGVVEEAVYCGQCGAYLGDISYGHFIPNEDLDYDENDIDYDY